MVRSLLVAIYDLGVKEIMIVGHSDCGAKHMDGKAMIQKMKERGISEDSLKLIDFCGVNFDTWLCGFESLETSVRGCGFAKEPPVDSKGCDGKRLYY